MSGIEESNGDMIDLGGQVALVTGAGQNAGRAIALELARHNCGGVAVNEIQHWEFAEPDPEDDRLVEQASYQTTSVYGFGHPLYYDNVLRVLRGEDEPETDGREGLRSLEVLIASYISARDGRRVSLPLDY